VGAVGVVGLGVGAAFGGLAISKHNQAKTTCPMTGCVTQDGVDQWSSARLYGNVSTGALIAGGVLVVGGVVLFATGGTPAKPRTAQIGFGPGSVTFQEVW
jgi:hypothetical protein